LTLSRQDTPLEVRRIVLRGASGQPSDHVFTRNRRRVSHAHFETPVLRRRGCCGTSRGCGLRPALNVVFILADDLGWSDTTLYGTTKFYRTPNLEKLTERGMVFTHAYSASPLCSPTRASILSGQSPARTGVTAPNCHLPNAATQAIRKDSAPPNMKLLNVESATRFDTAHFTLAEAFKQQGYATGHFGKWHLGPTPYSPLEQGFDVDIPHTPSPGPRGGFVAPWAYQNGFKERAPGEHIEDRMADEAVAWMEKHKDQPFFLNYWQFSVHAPFDAKQKLIEKYRKSVDPTAAQRCAVYAAMVESMMTRWAP
jgi:arylsulfatase A-like enzyme